MLGRTARAREAQALRVAAVATELEDRAMAVLGRAAKADLAADRVAVLGAWLPAEGFLPELLVAWLLAVLEAQAGAERLPTEPQR